MRAYVINIMVVDLLIAEVDCGFQKIGILSESFANLDLNWKTKANIGKY